MTQPLTGIRVLELATGIEGPFASKMLADYGADVIKAEPPTGDPARSYLAGSANDAEGEDRERSPLFLHLNTNKRGIVADPSTPAGAERIRRIAATVDVVIESFEPGRMAQWGLGHGELQAANPALVTVSVTPFGQTGPYAHYKGEELVLYGMGGTLNSTGTADREPVKLGGEIGRYQCGNTAAMSALAAVMVARRSGHGVHVDVANLETQAGSMDRRMTYLLYRAYTGRNAPREERGRVSSLPSGFFPAEDGYVQLATMPAWLPRMLRTIGDPDLAARYQDPAFLLDEELAEVANAAMYDYTLARTAQAAMEEAQANGWPITALKTPNLILEDEHWRERGFFVDVDHPVAGTVRQPGAPIRMADGWVLRRPAPTLGQHDAEVDAELQTEPARSVGNDPTPAAPANNPATLPLDGLRVLDMTVVWSGPFATMLLGELGAEVIRVENPWIFPSVTRGLFPRPPKELANQIGPIFGPYPDREPGERPWNRVGLFTSHARNKRCISLDLRRELGRETFLRLVEVSDVLIENNTATLLDKLDLGWDDLRARNPRLIVVRMPATGLAGKYRDYSGFGLHFETLCGLSAIRGYADTDPSSLTSAFHMDAASGPAAAFATLAALRRREQTGTGELVELVQAENMMQHIGELFVEAALTGMVHGPLGNRHRSRAPQGVYPTLPADDTVFVDGAPEVGAGGNDRWVAISVGSDEEWAGLRQAMGDPAWAAADRFGTATGRREHHDEIDQHLQAWTEGLDAVDVFHRCQAEGVPAGPVHGEDGCYADPQLRARGFFRENGNEELGTHEYGGHSWRWDGPDLAWRPIPVFGGDNDYVFRDLLGLTDDEYDALDADGHLARGYLAPDGSSL